MPVLSTAVVEAAKIAPAIRRKLLNKLSIYSSLHTQKKALEHAMEKAKNEIEVLREETGEATLSLEGYSITLVAPIRSKFNPKKFVQLGGDLALYNNAHEDVLSKPYTKVTLPGDRNDE